MVAARRLQEAAPVPAPAVRQAPPSAPSGAQLLRLNGEIPSGLLTPRIAPQPLRRSLAARMAHFLGSLTVVGALVFLALVWLRWPA